MLGHVQQSVEEMINHTLSDSDLAGVLATAAGRLLLDVRSDFADADAEAFATPAVALAPAAVEPPRIVIAHPPAGHLRRRRRSARRGASLDGPKNGETACP